MSVARPISNPFSVVVILSLLPFLVLAPHSSLADDFEGFDFEEAEVEEGGDVEQSSYYLGHRIPPESSISTPPPDDVEEELWDEDEFEGFPFRGDVPADPDVDEDEEETDKPFTLNTFAIEISCAIFLAAYLGNFFLGSQENERIALAWVRRFAARDSIFDKTFDLLQTGTGANAAPLLLKEGHDSFKFYATGRRFCQGLYATIDLRSRHDLISRIVDFVTSREDVICFQVFMNDEAMDQVLFAMARRKGVKGMLREEKDLESFAGLVPAGFTGRKWVSNELAVLSESKEVAGDLLTDLVLEKVFSDKVFEKVGRGFLSLHFTDQHPSSHKKMLIFKFCLPSPNKIDDVAELMPLVPYYIDLIGRYRLSSQTRSKTEAARAKAAQCAYKELQIARQDALKKKIIKRKLMEEVETKIRVDAINRKEEKQRARLMKKTSQKVKLHSH